MKKRARISAAAAQVTPEQANGSSAQDGKANKR